MVLHPEPRTQGWLSRSVLPHEIICAVTVQKQDFRSKSFLLTQTFWVWDLAVGSGVRAGAALILQVLPCPPVPGHTSQELVLLSSLQLGPPAQCPEDLRSLGKMFGGCTPNCQRLLPQEWDWGRGRLVSRVGGRGINQENPRALPLGLNHWREEA